MLRKAGNFLRYLFGILMMLAGAGYWKEEKAYALSLLLLGIFLLPVTWNTIKKRFHVAKALPVLLPVLLPCLIHSTPSVSSKSACRTNHIMPSSNIFHFSRSPASLPTAKSLVNSPSPHCGAFCRALGDHFCEKETRTTLYSLYP